MHDYLGIWEKPKRTTRLQSVDACLRNRERPRGGKSNYLIDLGLISLSNVLIIFKPCFNPISVRIRMGLNKELHNSVKDTLFSNRRFTVRVNHRLGMCLQGGYVLFTVRKGKILIIFPYELI